MDRHYNVVFTGALRAGVGVDAASRGLAEKFGLTEHDAHKILARGTRRVLKHEVPTAKAQRYQAALERIGLEVTLEQTGVDALALDLPADAATPEPAPSMATLSALGVTPIGAEELAAVVRAYDRGEEVPEASTAPLVPAASLSSGKEKQPEAEAPAGISGKAAPTESPPKAKSGLSLSLVPIEEEKPDAEVAAAEPRPPAPHDGDAGAPAGVSAKPAPAQAPPLGASALSFSLVPLDGAVHGGTEATPEVASPNAAPAVPQGVSAAMLAEEGAIPADAPPAVPEKPQLALDLGSIGLLPLEGQEDLPPPPAPGETGDTIFAWKGFVPKAPRKPKGEA